jgi:hypothetical protein
MTYSEFKQSFGFLLQDYDIYDQLPDEGAEYPFITVDTAIITQHSKGNINAARVILDIWDKTTNSRQMDILVDTIAAKISRVSVDAFYGIIESIKTIPEDEGLQRVQIVGNYTILGGY